MTSLLQLEETENEELAGPGGQGAVQRTPGNVPPRGPATRNQARSRDGGARPDGSMASHPAVGAADPQGVAVGGRAKSGHSADAPRQTPPARAEADDVSDATCIFSTPMS